MEGYQRGYLDGYRDARAEAADTEDPRLGEQEAEGIDPAELEGQPEANEGEAAYWLGYAHGRFHGRTGSPAEGVAGRVPPGL